MKTTNELSELMRAKGFISTKEAAAITGRRLQTIRHWCKSGKVAFTRNSCAYFVELDSLEQYTGATAQRKEIQ